MIAPPCHPGQWEGKPVPEAVRETGLLFSALIAMPTPWLSFCLGKLPVGPNCPRSSLPSPGKRLRQQMHRRRRPASSAKPNREPRTMPAMAPGLRAEPGRHTPKGDKEAGPNGVLKFVRAPNSFFSGRPMKSEFNPWDSHDERTEPTPSSFSLNSIYAHHDTCT